MTYLKDRHIRRVIVSLIITVIMLTACSRGEEKELVLPTSPTATVAPTEAVAVHELPLHHIDPLTAGKFSAKVEEYYFGKKEYVSSSNRVMPYEIRGIIGIPQGEGPFPLVLISHGSHSNMDETLRFDTGFDYLVQHLAEHGYVAAAMDMSKPYIWKYGDNDDNEKSIPVANDHIEKLLADLSEIIDRNRIALIGHSRGGETVFDIANDQAEKGRSIQAIVALAPTYFNDRVWPQADVAILVPEYDGDVISLDGFHTYRALQAAHNDNDNEEAANSNNSAAHVYSVTQLLKGNHNYFNRNIERNDAPGSLVANTDVDQLTREEQEYFLKNFVVDFFNASLKAQPDAFLQVNQQQPNTMYGFDVTVMYETDEASLIVDALSLEQYKASAGLALEQKIDSWFYKHDEVLIDTITFGEEEFMTRKLLKLSWDKQDATVKIKPKLTDFSNYQSIQIQAVVDAVDERNIANQSQRFTVQLQDTNGNIARVVLPNELHALYRFSGKIDATELEEETLSYWSRATPLAGVQLPLQLFESVNLSDIEDITIIFDQVEEGAIYLDRIVLQ